MGFEYHYSINMFGFKADKALVERFPCQNIQAFRVDPKLLFLSASKIHVTLNSNLKPETKDNCTKSIHPSYVGFNWIDDLQGACSKLQLIKLNCLNCFLICKLKCLKQLKCQLKHVKRLRLTIKCCSWKQKKSAWYCFFSFKFQPSRQLSCRGSEV